MPMKMISETPLPMPLSVICSPSHIRNSVPATIAMMAKSRYQHAVVVEDADFSIAFAMNVACIVPSTIVSQRVYWLIFLRPSSPPFLAISSSCGSTTVINCMMIEALM